MRDATAWPDGPWRWVLTCADWYVAFALSRKRRIVWLKNYRVWEPSRKFFPSPANWRMWQQRMPEPGPREALSGGRQLTPGVGGAGCAKDRTPGV